MPFNEDGTRKTMAYKKGPFKMKGSPMQRNFGVGSPLHDETEEEIKGTILPEVTVTGKTDDKKVEVSRKKLTDVSLKNRKKGYTGYLVTYSDGSTKKILSK